VPVRTDGLATPPGVGRNRSSNIARTTNYLVHETQEVRNWTTFPRGAVAIASNGSGDRLILRAEVEDIEFWDHETGECLPVSVAWTRSPMNK
jgi:hypothetical protein